MKSIRVAVAWIVTESINGLKSIIFRLNSYNGLKRCLYKLCKTPVARKDLTNNNMYLIVAQDDPFGKITVLP